MSRTPNLPLGANATRPALEEWSCRYGRPEFVRMNGFIERAGFVGTYIVRISVAMLPAFDQAYRLPLELARVPRSWLRFHNFRSPCLD